MPNELLNSRQSRVVRWFLLCVAGYVVAHSAVLVILAVLPAPAQSAVSDRAAAAAVLLLAVGITALLNRATRRKSPRALASGWRFRRDRRCRMRGAAVAAGGLVGGYRGRPVDEEAAARRRRPGGGRGRGGAGVAADERRRRAAGLTAAYVAAFAGAHPLAKKMGAWPAVFSVAGGMALASWAVTRKEG